MSAEENEALARLYWEEAINKGNLDVLDEVYNPDSVIHDPASDTGELRGADVKEDCVICAQRLPRHPRHYRGSSNSRRGHGGLPLDVPRHPHQGEFMGVTPTGKEVEVTGIDIVRIVGGKIVDVWSVWDAWGLMRQLGAIPEPGQS
jgi:hypothetical protein